MKKFRWQLLILFVAGLIVGILLILEKRGGLGITSTPQPVEGGIYTEAIIGSLVRLNPLLDSANQADRDVDQLIFSGLVRFDSTGVPQPELAEITTSLDGLIYNVKLKESLTWHDGQPLTSADVIFTIDLIKNGKGFIPDDIIEMWKSIEAIQLDDQNLQFKLAEPFAPFQDYLTFGILPKHILGRLTLTQILDSDFNLNPVGSGPFKFAAITVEGSTITGIKLEAFKEYSSGAPFIQEINFRYYPDAESAFKAYQDGFVQGISQIPSNLLQQALAQPDLSIYTGRLPQISMILLNLNDPEVPFFQDTAIRKALLTGINRQRIVKEYFNGQAILANSVILPGTWAYLDTLPTSEYDPEQAALALKESGYVVTGDENPVRMKEKQVLRFFLSFPDDELHLKIAESIQKDWQQLSIDVILDPIPPDVFLTEKLVPRAYQAALVDINLSRTPDPDPYPFRIIHSGIIGWQVIPSNKPGSQST
jgi:peptide/nickel transport system substrate-binding protein